MWKWGHGQEQFSEWRVELREAEFIHSFVYTRLFLGSPGSAGAPMGNLE